MYAIVELGARQYNVKVGDIIEVEKESAATGKDIKISRVLLLSKGKSVEIGTPYLKGVTVVASVLDPVKARKVISFKYRRRKSSHWTKGHRQQLSRLKIKEIETG